MMDNKDEFSELEFTLRATESKWSSYQQGRVFSFHLKKISLWFLDIFLQGKATFHTFCFHSHEYYWAEEVVFKI